MTKISYSNEFLEDTLRLVDFLMEKNPDIALGTYDIIAHGIELLKTHPEIGRQVTKSDLRELVISRGNSGYIALYYFDEVLDLVTMMAIRHQRELEYHREKQ